MSTSLLDEPAVRSSTSPAQRLRTSTAAVRLAISWLGVRKTLTADQKNQAAESFGAQGNFLSVGKKLLDTTHPSFKAVTVIKNKGFIHDNRDEPVVVFDRDSRIRCREFLCNCLVVRHMFVFTAERSFEGKPTNCP